MKKTRGYVALIVGAVLLTSAASRQVDQPYADDGRTKVGILGDSLSVQGTQGGSSGAAFGPTYDLAVEAIVGNRAIFDTENGPDPYWNLDWIDQLAGPGPRAVVIELGTNDAGAIRDGRVTVAQVIDGLEALGDRATRSAPGFVGTDCVVYVTVDTTNPSWGPTQAEALNDWIRDQPYVYDWDAWVSDGHDGLPYFPATDDPHATAAGYDVLYNGIRGIVDTCPPARS